MQERLLEPSLVLSQTSVQELVIEADIARGRLQDRAENSSEAYDHLSRGRSLIPVQFSEEPPVEVMVDIGVW